MEKEKEWHITISKEKLAELPVQPTTGSFEVVDTPEKAVAACDILSSESEIGFDTETKPSFRKGVSHNVALLQLSTHDICYLFRLNLIGMPDAVKSLLENPDILKVGLSIRDDFHNLHKNYRFEPDGFIDLQNYVKEFKISDNSLSKINAILFGTRISKGQRLTNWEAQTLTVHQQAYAALDAFACLRIYDTLNSGCFDPTQSKYRETIEPPTEESDL